MANVRDIFPTYWDQSNWHNLGGGPLFGNADLDILLQDAAGGPTPQNAWDNRQRLKDAKALIEDFMRKPAGLAVTDSSNKPGISGGMYDKFTNSEIYETWGDHSGEGGEQRKTSFGGADFRVAVAKGKNQDTIREKLRSEPNWLKEGNRSIKDGGAEDGIWTYLVGVEESTNPGQPEVVEVVPGQGGDKYGNVEYHMKLKEIWNATKDPAELHAHREFVLDFLKNESDDKVAASNRPGVEGGMYEQIKAHQREKPRDSGRNWESSDVKITPWFGGPDPEGTDPTSIESERSQFTEADWLAAKAGGHDDYDVYRHLRANKDQYKGTTSKQTYDTVRQGLVDRAPIYSFSDGGGNWRAELENPLWQEVGEYLATSRRQDRHRTWVDEDDHTTIEYYLAQNFDGDIKDFRTDADLATIIGHAGTGAGSAGWTPGEYWSQWGTEGPPDLPGDSDMDADLTMIQKMVAQAGLEADDPATWKDRLENLENKFLDELYKGTDADPAKFKAAPDEWGLDIMRVGLDGDAFDFSSNDETWYETLTRGDIDWAFYQESKIYQRAKEELGLEGTYTAGSLGVAGIRQANVWVHGQLAVIPDTDGPAWDPYVKQPLPAPYTPKELTITGYTPDKPKGLAPVPEESLAPTINIPDVKIKAPDNLKQKIGKIVGE